MKILWQTLPVDIVHLILEYDKMIKLRNGKYMNQILNIDINYILILDRMRFQRYRNFDRETRHSFVDICIQNTEKSIYYIATERGFRVTLHTKNQPIYPGAKILYSNMMDRSNV